jgi:hypothetical protein
LIKGEQPGPVVITGGPVARIPTTGGPGTNILAAGGHGPSDQYLTNCCRPWIKLSTHEAKKIQNPSEIFIFFAIWKIM